MRVLLQGSMQSRGTTIYAAFMKNNIVARAREFPLVVSSGTIKKTDETDVALDPRFVSLF